MTALGDDGVPDVARIDDHLLGDPEFAASSTASARLVELARWSVAPVDGPLAACTLVSEPLASGG